jgi:type II secretion system protein I
MLQYSKNKIRAFTLMEVLIALSITAIALIPLLQLLVKSITVMDSASCLSRASLIGNARLAETIGQGYPQIGTDSGVIREQVRDVTFKWKVTVADVRDKELSELNINDIRSINVTIMWDEGRRQKNISVSTFVSKNDIKAAIAQVNRK